MVCGELELGVSVRLVDPSHLFYVCVDLRVGLIKMKKEKPFGGIYELGSLAETPHICNILHNEPIQTHLFSSGCGLEQATYKH